MTASTEENFAQRLIKACDDCIAVPEYGRGRQVVIAEHLNVSQEAVRKWFSNIAVPKRDKMRKLAEFLDVDEAWLSLGIKPELSKDDRKLARKVAEGAVLVVAGTIQLAGGNCAFPTEDDPKSSYIDIYAILRGVKMDVHVSVAKEISEHEFEVVVPREFAEVRCVGYFPARTAMFTLVDLRPDLIARHKATRAGDFLVTISRDGGRYFTGDDEWPKLKTHNWTV